MSVHRRALPSGRVRWEVRWREGNTNKSRLFDTRRAADDFDREVRRLRQGGEFSAEMQRRRVTINDVYVDWLDRSQPSLSDKAAKNYATQLDLRILPEFGHRRVASLTVADVERWFARMRADGAGDPTILKANTVLQALISLAIRDGVVSVNVAQQARKPGQGRTRIPYLIKPEKVEIMRACLLAEAAYRDVMLLELLAYAGLRPESEAITLPWELVRDRSMLVRDTKRRRERSVPLVAPLRESLAQWRMRRGRPAGTELVVPTNVEGPWSEHDWRNWRRRPFARAAEAAELPRDVRPRDLRGSFASLLVHEGRSIVEVARIMGHSPAICLRDYAQIFDEFDPDNRIDADESIRRARAAAAQQSINNERAS